jgi:two-component system, sensor histidine kinase and response regulator
MKKILAIDDNRDNLLVLKALLSESFQELNFFTALSGRDGIQIAQAENPDVILLDLVMPEMDGFEVCSVLKNSDQTRYIPVVILTAARVGPNDRINALKIGADAFLSKPVDEVELTTTVLSMIRIKESETKIRNENVRLEKLVAERTADLQNQLEEKRKTEISLQKSFEELEISKQATLKLLEEIKVEIEQRRRAEEQLGKINTELEIRVKMRTEQLENLNRELESFSYSVSHDLRAPLRAIDGFSKFLLENHQSQLDNEGKKLLGNIRLNTRRMDTLIVDILALSRITRSDLKKSEIDMAKMVLSMFNECISDDQSKRIEFLVDSLPNALGDPVYLKQVWTNLISNALKFTSKKDKPVIRVGSRKETDKIIYYISDNGAGFNPEYCDKLFSVFQRLHHHDDFEGTGVGLAIVKRIVLRHGGDVWAEGYEGEGASFYFSLPA